MDFCHFYLISNIPLLFCHFYLFCIKFLAKLNPLSSNLAKIASGNQVGGSIVNAMTTILQGGSFSGLNNILKKLTPFLGSFGALVNMFGLYEDATQFQQLNQVIKMIDQGFRKMDEGFNKVGRDIANMKNKMEELDFNSKVTKSIDKLNDAKNRFESYFKMDIKTRDDPKSTLIDIDLRDSVFDGLKRLDDYLKGEIISQIPSACKSYIKTSKVDRLKVMSFLIEMFNWMLSGSRDLILIYNILKLPGIKVIEKESFERLQTFGEIIERCDKRITEDEWKTQWEDDLIHDVLNAPIPNLPSKFY